MKSVISHWEVIVGNIGIVYSGSNGFDANKIYKEYVGQSKQNYGRASREQVTLMLNGEPESEHFPARISQFE